MHVDRFRALFLGGAALVSLVVVACGPEPTLAPTAVPPTSPATPDAAALATPLPAQSTPAPTTPARTPVPTPRPTLAAAAPPAPTPIATPTAALSPTATSLPSPASTSTPAPIPAFTPAPLPLELLSPQDGASSEVSAVRVLGKTMMDTVAEINGVPVEVEADGSFRRDLVLEEGPNTIQVMVTDRLGRAETRQQRSLLLRLPSHCLSASSTLGTGGRCGSLTSGYWESPNRTRWWRQTATRWK